MNTRTSFPSLALIAALFAGAFGAPSLASPEPDPRQRTLDRLATRITAEFEDVAFENVVEFLETVGDIEIEPAWSDDNLGEGLDRDEPVSIAARELPILTILERVLVKTSIDFDENAWQLSPEGVVEIGPKSRLNRSAYLKVYDIRDMLFTVPSFGNVPELNLDSALQQGGQGGGGGGSIFDQQDDDVEIGGDDREAAQELIDVIIEFVEPEQWQDNGGDGGTVRYWQGTLLVRAPAYMHRQLGGYDFWPRSLPTSADARHASAVRTEARLARRDERRAREAARERANEADNAITAPQ